ncbi:hypothetical protein Tsubulata_027682 [Turnera subulata]|uniref:F-box domain-containing protein n=1 Tax=Turnera subulata TaxID=218843 RepID=A0A9Q0IZ51_9ROSI|nr:hypothetical protein Tsubulata_027682 [Turnera subulata]
MGKKARIEEEKMLAATGKADKLVECDGRSVKSTKKGRKGSKSTDQSVDSGTDFISYLPDDIIHRILSLLRSNKDAARTTVLSKRWRHIWASSSILELDERKFVGHQHRKLRGIPAKEANEIRLLENDTKRRMFRDFVDKTLQGRIERKSFVQKFALHLTSYDDLEVAPHVDRWLNCVSDCNIQELDLHIPRKKGQFYILPEAVFHSKTLTALKISGCDLRRCKDMKLPNLRKLCLENLSVDDEKMQNFFLSCPLIEDLRLISCFGPENLLVVSDKLQRVDLHFSCRGLKNIELQAPNLQTFWYCRKKSKACKINLSVCKSLKNLTLGGPGMTNNMFQNHFSNFPLLEQLMLCNCSSLKIGTISSSRLKTLVLRDCGSLVDADIDAPNLQSFEYKGREMPFSSLQPSSLKEAKFYFEPPKKQWGRPMVGFVPNGRNSYWSSKMQRFLGKLDVNKGLKLVVCYQKNVIIHEDLRDMLIPPTYHAKIELVKSSVCSESLLENVLRTCRPKMLSIVSSTDSNFPEKANEKMMNREKKPNCCIYNTVGNKCWRHFLINVNIENAAADVVDSDKWTDWLNSVGPKCTRITTFKLDWS